MSASPADPRGRAAAGLSSWTPFLAVVAAALLFLATPARERLDGAAFDTIAKLFRAYAPRAVPEDVVIVGIDERTERALSEPLAMWHEHLGRVLAAVSAGGPRAIALDVVLPDRSFDEVRPGLDAALIEGLAAAKRAAPLAVGLALDGEGRPRPVHPLLLAAVGEDAISLAHAIADPDGIVRRFAPGLGQGPQAPPAFAERVVGRLGGDVRGGGLIDFSCGSPFQYVPLIDVLSWAPENVAQAARAAFGDRVVLIGSVLPDIDRVRQPVSLAAWEPHADAPPGVVLQAQTVRALQSGCLIEPMPPALLAALIMLAALLTFVRRTAVVWFAAVLAGVGLCAAVTGFYRLGLFVGPSAPLLALALAATGRTVRDALEQRRARAEVERRFAGYVSPNVLAGILAREIDAERPRKLSDVAFLFADIRGFTTFSERTPAEVVVDRLNRYYEAMIPVIHAHGGTIDNFRGDGIMAMFGAPLPTTSPARDAARAAKGMFDRLVELNRQLSADGVEPIAIGIGLAVGEAVMGNIGAADRHDYTAIGDVVNVAARLQSLCKSLGMRLIATAEIARTGELALESLGELELAGHTPVEAFGWPSGRGGGEFSAGARPSSP